MNPNQNSEAIWRRTRLQQALRRGKTRKEPKQVDDEDGGGLEEAVVIDEQEFLEGIQNCQVEEVCGGGGGGGEREDKVVESVRSSCSVVSESGDTEKMNVEEDEEIGEICSASKECGDTEEMNVEKEEEIGESETEDGKSKGGEEYMRCLLDVLKLISEVDDDDDDDDDGEVDIIETAKRRGMTFPKSRFLS
ncbi:hypothetical protein SOVF_171540 [Spinacia oleracea]|nr:hypothetical protein SOVF_171540 [Spinacia oleracea]